jgi:hypothetical protein
MTIKVHQNLQSILLGIILIIMPGCDIDALKNIDEQAIEELRSSGGSEGKDVNIDPPLEDNTDIPEEDNSTEPPEDSEDPELPFDPEPMIKGFVVGSEGYIPLIEAEVYIVGEEENKVKVDEYGNFKIDPVSTDPVDLIIIHYQKGISIYISGIIPPTLESGAENLGTITLDSSSSVFGNFLLNAEDHPSETPGDRKRLLNLDQYVAEILNPATNLVAYRTKVEKNGSFIVDGLAPGVWKIRYKDTISGIVSDTVDVTTTAGLVTTVLPTSSVNYDSKSYAATLTGIDTGLRQISVSDLSEEYPYDFANIVYLDGAGSEVSTEQLAYTKNIIITLPATAESIKISYQYTDIDTNIHHSPLFIFNDVLKDSDGDTYLDLVDCDDSDANNYLKWHRLLEDKDGDDYFVIPVKGVCAGNTMPVNYSKANPLHKFDCDDNNALLNTAQAIENDSTEEISYICAGPGNDIPSGYRNAYVDATASVFPTPADEDDIYYLGVYTVDNDKPTAGTIVLPPLTKDTRLYLGSYDQVQWTVITNGGEGFLKGVYTNGYGGLRFDPIIKDSLANPVAGVDIETTGLGQYWKSSLKIGHYYNTRNMIDNYNYHSLAFKNLPIEIGGNVRFNFNTYDIRGVLDLNNFLP